MGKPSATTAQCRITAYTASRSVSVRSTANVHEAGYRKNVGLSSVLLCLIGRLPRSLIAVAMNSDGNSADRKTAHCCSMKQTDGFWLKLMFCGLRMSENRPKTRIPSNCYGHLHLQTGHNGRANRSTTGNGSFVNTFTVECFRYSVFAGELSTL